MTRLGSIGGSAIVSLAVALSCGGTKKIDGETHFLCAADSDCVSAFGGGYGCVQKTCVKRLASASEASRDASVLQCVPGETSPCIDKSGCAGTTTCVGLGLFGACGCPDAGSFYTVKRAEGGASGCVTSEFKGEQISRALYVLLDQSAKMNETPADAGTTWWQAATGGIGDFFRGPIQAVGSFGLQYFPLGTGPASCGADYGTPDTVIGTSIGIQLMVDSLSAHSPQGLAATGPALQESLAYVKGQSTTLRSVVLITAGPPGECQPNTIADLAALAASARSSDPQVLTYVIALGNAASLFDPVAAAGGTTLPFKVTSGNARRSVTDAFINIIGFHPVCTYDVERLAGQGNSTDPTLLSISFRFADNVTSAVTRVPSVADCANLDRDGWYYDSTTHAAVLCPDLCDHPRANLRYEYGCRPSATDGGVRCGDGVCSAPESAFSCPSDCMGFCGDGFCGNGESPQNCAPDCGPGDAAAD